MLKLKEMFNDWKYIKICLYVIITAALLYVLYLIIGNLDHIIVAAASILQSLSSAFAPLIIGILIAYILSPLVDVIDKKIVSKLIFKLPDDPVKLEKRLELRRTVSILITFLLLIVVICVVIYAFAVLIVGDLVFTSLKSMIDSIVAYFSKYESVLLQWAQNLPAGNIEERLQGIVSGGVGWVSDNISTSAILSIIAKAGGSLLNILIGVVISIYLLKDKAFFLRLCRKTLHLLLPMKAHARVTETLSDINTVVSQFVRGQLLDALVVAIMASIGFTLIGLEFAVFLGCFAGLCNVIPYFGPFISAVPAAMVGFLTGGLSEGLLAVLVVIIIQQIDSNITYPRIVGSSIGLHPLFILVSVTVGGFYGGLVGLIIAVPIAAIIKVFLIKKIDSIN